MNYAFGDYCFIHNFILPQLTFFDKILFLYYLILMPFETYIVEPGSDILEGDRSHEEVAEEITGVFEDIQIEAANYTAIAMADKTTHSGAGGHPDGATTSLLNFLKNKTLRFYRLQYFF